MRTAVVVGATCPTPGPPLVDTACAGSGELEAFAGTWPSVVIAVAAAGEERV